MNRITLKHIIAVIIFVTLVIFIYVAVLNEIKAKYGDRLKKIELLSEKQNRMEAAFVEIQKLTAEDRIVKFAIDSLKMIRPKENLETISISSEQINQLEKILNRKYE
jgi:hypothetical protein